MSKVVNIINNEARLIDVLNKLMEQADININQLSRNTGLANTTIKRMCTAPDCNPTLTSIVKIADFFSITPNQLIGADPIINETNVYYPDFQAWSNVPIINLDQILMWPDNIEEIKELSDIQYVYTDIDINEKVFATIIADETLEPRFSPGTMLIFDPTLSPRNKNIVIIQDKEKDLPQFRQVLVDGPDIYIKSLNPELAKGSLPQPMTEKHRILGVLIQAKSNYI